MRKDTFHSLLEKQLPATIDLAEVASLVERHPYSHVVRLAYLRALRACGDDRLERELDLAAVHMPNRKVLYSFMQVAEESTSTRSVAQATAQLELEQSSEAADMGAEKDNAVAQEELGQELQRQYLTEAVQSTILMEVSEVQEETKTDMEVEAVEATPASPASFLDFISGEAIGAVEVKSERHDQALINRFLNSEKREKVEFFDPERMAQKSLVDKGGVVSDTLARIYMNQGNYNKALEAYEQLILKYPEKSGYFAARIQKVKDLKNNK